MVRKPTPCLSPSRAASRLRARKPAPLHRAAALVTTRGKTAPSGGKAGVTLGKAGATLRRLLPAQIPEQISDERATALYTIQDYLQQTAVIAQCRS